MISLVRQFTIRSEYGHLVPKTHLEIMFRQIEWDTLNNYNCTDLSFSLWAVIEAGFRMHTLLKLCQHRNWLLL